MIKTFRNVTYNNEISYFIDNDYLFQGKPPVLGYFHDIAFLIDVHIISTYLPVPQLKTFFKRIIYTMARGPYSGRSIITSVI